VGQRVQRDPAPVAGGRISQIVGRPRVGKLVHTECQENQRDAGEKGGDGAHPSLVSAGAAGGMSDPLSAMALCTAAAVAVM